MSIISKDLNIFVSLLLNKYRKNCLKGNDWLAEVFRAVQRCSSHVFHFV